MFRLPKQCHAHNREKKNIVVAEALTDFSLAIFTHHGNA